MVFGPLSLLQPATPVVFDGVTMTLPRPAGLVDITIDVRNGKLLADSEFPHQPCARRDLAGVFTFPFFTIENVAMVDAEHIIVANDNNLPFSIGRFTDRAADNEFILLRVPENADSGRIDETRKRAEELLGELKGGADFARVLAVARGEAVATEVGGGRRVERHRQRLSLGPAEQGTHRVT